MEFLLPLIFIMIPVIAKLVEKKIAKGGAAPVAPKPVLRTLIEELEDIELDDDLESDFEEDLSEEKEQAVEPVAKPVAAPVLTPVVAAPQKKEVQHKEKVQKKIDPKKLIVYSEIMKPKYMETN